tara:strand:+ start:851 stop:2110 length:1260 start_codon:yes stop_codon:yes gene_type:complete
MPKIAAGATNKNISIAPHGTGKVVVGTGAADATLQSDGDFNLVLKTGNSTTGKIEIVDGANGNIDITPNGTGEVDIPKVDIDGGTVDGISLGTNSAVTEAQIDNINIDGNAITSTNTNGNIDLTPAGTGEVNISKVDIDGGAIDATDVTVGSGKTLDVSAGSLTTSTAQKQAIIDGASIEGTAVESTGESGGTKFLREDGDGTSSWQVPSTSSSLPSQTGNADDLLTTNGTTASWTNSPINLVKLAFAGQSSAPATPSAGTVYYHSTDNVQYVYNGTSWVATAGETGSIVKVHGPYTYADVATITTDGYLSGFEQALTVVTGNDIICVPSVIVNRTAGPSIAYWAKLYLTGGSLGATTSGHLFTGLVSNQLNDSVYQLQSEHVLDTNPGTSPTYKIYGYYSGATWNFTNLTFTFFEIQG